MEHCGASLPKHRMPSRIHAFKALLEACAEMLSKWHLQYRYIQGIVGNTSANIQSIEGNTSANIACHDKVKAIDALDGPAQYHAKHLRNPSSDPSMVAKHRIPSRIQAQCSARSVRRDALEIAASEPLNTRLQGNTRQYKVYKA